MSCDDLYLNSVIKYILSNGDTIKSRNSETLRSTDLIMKFTSTPLISIRRTAWKNALREFEWFLSGSNNLKDLHKKVRHWWSPWCDEYGVIYNGYSEQFRYFCGYEKSVDQIDYLINGITKDPFSRRNVITTWNTADMNSAKTPIANCHGSLIQFYVDSSNKLNLSMHQRSSDVIVGLPHNLIQYWAFLLWMSHRTHLIPGNFTWIGGDCHIYKDHIELAHEMSRSDTVTIKTPNLIYTPTSNDFKADDFSLDNKYIPLIKKSASLII